MTARCEGSSLVCNEVIKNTQSGEQVQARGKHSIFDPPCEKFPVPRTWCVRLGGNNSPGPLTSSFGLLRFMTLSSAVQLLSPQLCLALIGLEFEGRGWGGRDREAAGMRWEADLIRDTAHFYHSHYRWVDGYNFPCGPHVPASSHRTTRMA